jgi:uncharacterized SAM-binding protein YcdF (DUF218 family)
MMLSSSLSVLSLSLFVTQTFVLSVILRSFARERNLLCLLALLPVVTTWLAVVAVDIRRFDVRILNPSKGSHSE